MEGGRDADDLCAPAYASPSPRSWREPAADAATLAQLQAEIVRLEKKLGEARTDPLAGLPCQRTWTQQTGRSSSG